MDVIITIQTADGFAQGMLFKCKMTKYELFTVWSQFTAGSDYERVSRDLVFTASPVLTQCVNITIIQDGAVENTVEFFSVQASTSNSSINGLPTTRTVIIQDMDRK